MCFVEANADIIIISLNRIPMDGSLEVYVFAFDSYILVKELRKSGLDSCNRHFQAEVTGSDFFG